MVGKQFSCVLIAVLCLEEALSELYFVMGTILHLKGILLLVKFTMSTGIFTGMTLLEVTHLFSLPDRGKELTTQMVFHKP